MNVVGMKVIVMDPVLAEFEVRWGSDTGALNPWLVHMVCGERVCEVEHADQLSVLAAMAQDHECPGGDNPLDHDTIREQTGEGA